MRLLLVFMSFGRTVLIRFMATFRSFSVTMGFSVGLADLVCTGHFRVGILNAGEIAYPGLRIQILQHNVCPLTLTESRHTALRIVDIAQDERIARARLLARGLEFADRNFILVARAGLYESCNLGLFDPLNTKGA